jgi:hypothetical protein
MPLAAIARDLPRASRRGMTRPPGVPFRLAREPTGAVRVFNPCPSKSPAAAANFLLAVQAPADSHAVGVEVIDPAYAPDPGTPEIGGISAFQAQSLVRGLSSSTSSARSRRGLTTARPDGSHHADRRHHAVRIALRHGGKGRIGCHRLGAGGPPPRFHRESTTCESDSSRCGRSFGRLGFSPPREARRGRRPPPAGVVAGGRWTCRDAGAALMAPPRSALHEGSRRATRPA